MTATGHSAMQEGAGVSTRAGLGGHSYCLRTSQEKKNKADKHALLITQHRAAPPAPRCAGLSGVRSSALVLLSWGFAALVLAPVPRIRMSFCVERSATD